MRKYLFFTLLLVAVITHAHAQGKDNAIEKLMSKRILTYEDASYNAALLIPRLYKENKQDTINAVVDYYQKNYGNTAPIMPYIIISKIKNRTFKEEIENTWRKDSTYKYYKLSDSEFYKLFVINYYLTWYLDNYNIKTKQRYPEYLRTAYGDYFEFLKSFAEEQLKIKNLTSVEKFLLDFFVKPSDAMYKGLINNEYNGTSLQKEQVAYDKQQKSHSGAGLGLIAGMWIPNGSLSILGNHPYVGISAGFKQNKLMLSLAMIYRFSSSPQRLYSQCR